jgi:hydroxypyruvate isomerase
MLAANLSFLFQEVSFPERFGTAAAAGFTGVEFLFPYDLAPAEIVAQLKQYGPCEVPRPPHRPGAHARGGLGTIVGASFLGMGIACPETPTFEDLE